MALYLFSNKLDIFVPSALIVLTIISSDLLLFIFSIFAPEVIHSSEKSVPCDNLINLLLKSNC